MNYDVIETSMGTPMRLKRCLAILDYRQNGGAWRHPERQALFVGDFIDRGPQQRESVDVVRRMVDAGSARRSWATTNSRHWLVPSGP